MGAAREKGPADFDLERFIDMFDEALTSKDERVVNALRSLMMMVILTKPETRNPTGDRNNGPLRQLFEDMNNLNRRIQRMEDEINRERRYSDNRAYYQKNPWASGTATDYPWTDDSLKAHLKDEYYRIMQAGKTGQV